MSDVWDQAAQEYQGAKPPPSAGIPSDGSDAWKVWNTPDQPSNGPSALSRFGSNFAQTTGIPQAIDAIKNAPPPAPTPPQSNGQALWGAVKQGVSEAVTNSPPSMAWRLGKSVLQQSGQQLGKAYNAVTKGDYPSQPLEDRRLEGAGYAASAAVPVLGPMAAKAGEQIGSGDYAGGLGTAAGTLVQALAPAIARGATRAVKGTAAAFDADPTVAIVKALKPVASNEGFTERLPETLANIKAAVPYKIGGNQSLIDATQKAIDSHQQALESWMAPARQIGTRGSR